MCMSCVVWMFVRDICMYIPIYTTYKDYLTPLALICIHFPHISSLIVVQMLLTSTGTQNVKYSFILPVMVYSTPELFPTVLEGRKDAE